MKSLKIQVAAITLLAAAVAQAAPVAKNIDWTLKPRPELRSEEMCNPIEQVGVLSIAAVGTAYMAFETLPEDVTNWPTKLKDSSLWENYRRHTKQLVYDGDELLVNYVGHPYSGMAYYNMSRTCGRSPMQSFMFSVFMSTVWWEYGIEAFFEKPSIQDLFSTPIIGSLMGEAAYQAIQAIEDRDDRLLGSKFLGKSTKVFLDPFSSLLRAINATGVQMSVSPLVNPGDDSYGISLRAIYRWQSGPKYLSNRCELSAATERGQSELSNSQKEVSEDYDRLMKRGKYCKAALLAVRVEMEKPSWIQSMDARGKILKALGAGHFLVDQLMEIERQKFYWGDRKAPLKSALVGLTKSYVYYLPTRNCTEPAGVLIQANGKTLGFRQEAAMIGMLTASNLEGREGQVLDADLLAIQKSLAHCPR